MQEIRDLVERVAEALGAEAEPDRVEELAASLLSPLGGDKSTRIPAVRPALTGGSVHISLVDCSSLLANTVRTRSYDKIRRIASHLDKALGEVGIGGTRQISTSPLPLIAGKATGLEFVALGHMLEDAAADCGASSISGFSAPVERHLDKTSANLLSVVPEVLQSTKRLTIDIFAASHQSGTNVDAVLAAVPEIARLQDGNEDVLRVAFAANGSSDAMTASPDTELRLIFDARALIRATVQSASTATIDELCDMLAATAFQLGREAARHGRSAAETVRSRAGLDVRFGGIDLTLDADSGAAVNSLSTGVARGTAAAVSSMRCLPSRELVAFTSSTLPTGAVSALVDRLANAATTHAPLRLHALFARTDAGQEVAIGPFTPVTVQEPPENELIARGGRIHTGCIPASERLKRTQL